MIITQTPLRISFLGGGTDLPAFYEQEPGCVLSCTIDKYIYVILKSRFDDYIRAGYTRTELVESVAELEHDLVREALRATGVESGVEISTMGDIPSQGSGLGSSSTVTVGLLHALWLARGRPPHRRALAEGACEVEIERLGRPIGKQDQYAAAYGGLRFLTFTPEAVGVSEPVASAAAMGSLGQALMLFFTGMTRSSVTVLAEQAKNIEAVRESLRAIGALAHHGRRALASGDAEAIGGLMHESWVLKRTLSRGVSSAAIDGMYEAARRAGAVGGKLCGAGGGGFLLLYCRPEQQPAVRRALAAFRELDFDLDPHGTRVVANLPPSQLQPAHASRLMA